ncbi:TPA: hypothetical protein WH400_001059 [Neisseria meningitidis]
MPSEGCSDGENASHLHHVLLKTHSHMWARPLFDLEASASSSSTATPPLLPFACYDVARNLKFRPSENAKTAL